MTFSGTLKLKFGPFWLKTSILLVNVVTFGTRNATYVLRVERPSVCGGRIDLSIGRHGSPIELLSRSANDRRKLRFGIRYGAKAKTLRFIAPNAEVYGHWIAVLREAFGGNVKVAKRVRNKSATDEISSDDCSITGIQETLVASDSDSTSSHRGSNELDQLTKTVDPCHQQDHIVASMDVCKSNYCKIAGDLELQPNPDSFNEAIYTTTKKISAQHFGNQYCHVEGCPTSNAVTPVSSDNYVGTSEPSVFYMAIDDYGAAEYSVIVPPRKARTGQTTRSARALALPFVQWARRMARDIQHGEFLPEVFHLSSAGCKRLQLGEVLSIAQPYFMWLPSNLH